MALPSPYSSFQMGVSTSRRRAATLCPPSYNEGKYGFGGLSARRPFRCRILSYGYSIPCKSSQTHSKPRCPITELAQLPASSSPFSDSSVALTTSR